VEIIPGIASGIAAPAAVVIPVVRLVVVGDVAAYAASAAEDQTLARRLAGADVHT
jgi:siroheme synthase